MAKSFNLTAELNLRGPANLKTVVADIKRQLGTVGGNINVKIDPGAVKSIDGATRRIEALNSAIIKTRQNTNDLSASLRGLSSALGSVKSVGSVSAAGLKSTAESMNSAAKATQQVTSKMEEFGKQSALAIKRFAAFSFVTTGIFALTNAITRGVKEFIEFDRQIVKLQQVTGKSRSGLTGLSDEITRLSTTLGVSSSSLIEVASTLAQAGLSAEDTKIALEALAKTELAPSFDDLTKTTEGAIAALRQFGLQTSQLESALGSINAVAAAFAVESSDIIAAIQRTGGVFAAASKGVSEGTDALNEFIAVFTSVRATTRESAETIATGLRTIFTRIQRAGTIEQLKAFGVELTDLEGKFVGPYEAVRRLSEALNQLDPRDIRFASIVEELGGFRQIGKVIPLIQQFATAQEALKVAQRGQDSLTAAQVTAQQSLANQLAKVREQFLALVRDIGQSSAFQNLFKIVTNLASGLISLVGAFKPILPLLSLLAVVKGVGAITKFGAGFAKGFGGKGAGETGRNIGETVSGTAAKERAEATSKAADAIRLNTDAIKNLTSSIQTLDSTIKSRGSAGLNAGGKVMAFARGGVVPGTGNRDTVPAMLQPGEFVIRKKAVETLGANNLNKMNKYAGGGYIKKQLPGAADKLKEQSISYNNISRLKINDSGKGAIRGYMFENYVGNEYGVKAPDKKFPDIPNLSNRLKTKFGLTKAETGKNISAVELKYRSGLAPNFNEEYTPENTAVLYAIERNLGGVIKKFAGGGKALGARSKFKELSEEEILKLSTPDLIAYGKALAQDIFTTGGAGMAIGSEFIEVPPERIVPELESSLVSYMGKRGFWRERVAPFGRPVAKTQKQLSKQDRQSALEAQVSKQADEVAARSQQWTSIRSGSDIDNYLLSTLSDPILSDYKRVRGGESLDKQFHNTRLRKAVNAALDSYDNFDYSPGNIDKLVSGIAAKKFAYGGLVQKFADGLEVESVGKVSENILRRLEQLGGPGPIKQAVGLDFINTTIRQKLAGKKITAKDLLSPRSLRSIPDSASLLPAIEPVLEKAEAQQKAKQTAKKEQIARNLQAAAGGAYQFGLASIYGPNGELGYSSVSDAKQIEGKDGEKYLTQIIRKSLPTRYAEAIKQTRAELAALPQRAGERLQYVDIFGTGGPLAFDFDETLVKGADIFDENGKIDIKAYNDLNRVKKALQNAELTLLGQELKSRLSEYPQLMEGIRVLTARPPSNTPYLADTLSRLRLPIPESKITGVSGGLNKVDNLSDLETLIDDNLENIKSVLGGGKKAIQYQESKALNLEDKSTGKSMAVMEGYALEEMVRSWGVNIAGDDADPNRPIDFPQGLGALSRYWDLPGTIPVDTKRTNSSDALSRIFEEAQRFYVQNFKLGGQVYDLQKGTGLSNSEFDQLIKYGNTNDFTHQEFKDYLANYLKNKASKKNLMMNTGQLRDVLLSGTRTPEPTAKQLALAEQLKPYAEGGSAQDTVPALLTPGEFVINKKAAQKIGYSQLAKLNKADKLGIEGYNSGGIVGGIQKFADGGRLSKEERKRRKEQYMASGRGGVTRQEAYETGMPRPDYGGPAPSADAVVKKAKIDKIFQDQVDRLMDDIRDQVTSQYQRLYDQERASLRDYYNTKVAQAIKEGKDTAGIIAEYKGAVADAKQALESGLKTAIAQRQAEVPDIIAGRAERDLSSYRERTGTATVDTKPIEAKAKADRLAAEQATYFAYKAKQAGFTVEEYQRKLARETTKLAKDIKLNLVGRQQDLKFTSVNLGADLKGRSRDGSDSDKTVIRQAEEILIQKLKALNPGKAFQDIEKAASSLVDKLIESGGSFDDIKDSVDLVKESMDRTPESVDAVNQAMEEMAQQTGISIDILNNQIRNQVEAGQTAYGAFRQNFNDVIQSLGGYIRVLGIGLTIATDQISKLIVSLDANSKLDADLMARLGGIQGGAQGMVAGQAIGSEGRRLLERLFPNSAALGRRFEVFSTALGTIIGAINGAADAYNRAQLDKVLKGVSDSAKKVDIAFENLAKNNTPDAFNQAQKALAENAVAVSGLIDQANFGAGGPDRTRLEWMRGLDPTGITSSVTGQATEKEAREQLLTGVAELVNRARQLGDIRMSRVSGTEVEQSVKLAQDFDKKIADAVKTGNTGLATELRKQKTDQLAGTSQLFGQLRQTLATDNDAFLAIAAEQAARSGRTTPDQFSADMADPVKRNAAIEEGKRLSAMYAEQEQRSRLLADATRNIVIQTENLINIYGILDASLKRFSDAIDRIKNDAMDFADAYKGQASIKPVQRTDQDIFENIKAYSLDEVKGAAGRVSGLAGGGQVGADLERRIVGAKTIQEQLPKILAGITAQDSDKAIEELRGAFKNAGIEVDPAVFNELAAKLQSELTGKREGATVAELAQDPAIMENLSKISEESLKAAANLSKAFYDAMDKAVMMTNEYSKALQEATEWQLKAADIRAKADIQLAEVLGENLSLDELNAPADARIRSLSTSSVLPGGSLDPDELYGAIEQLANQRQTANEELQKRIMAAESAKTDEERVKAREAVDEQVKLMGEQNAEINNTQKALEELANDSSRASNALKKLQDYRASTRAGVNLAQDVLTADPKRLQEINKQLSAYNKTITGQATPQEMANVEFRQQAFGGLDMLKSVMPEKIAQQMQARMSRQMLTSMGVDLGQTIAIGPDNQAITLDQALTNVETGRDPQQEAYIEAYRQATERQAAAADRMSDAAIAVANNFQNAASSILAMATTNTGTTPPPTVVNVLPLPQQLSAAVEAAKPEPPKEETPTEPKPSEPLVPPTPTPAESDKLPGLIDLMTKQNAESAKKIVDAITALSAALAGGAAITTLEGIVNRAFGAAVDRIAGNVVDGIGNRLFGGGAANVPPLPRGMTGTPVPGGAATAVGVGGRAVAGVRAAGTAVGGTVGGSVAVGATAAYGGYVLFDWITSVGELITDFGGKMQEVADFAANQDTKGYFAQVLGNLKEPGNAMIQLIQEIGTLGSYAANTIGQQVGLVKDELAAADARLKELNAQAAGSGAVSFNKLDTTSQSRVKYEADTRLQLKKAQEIKEKGGSAADVSNALGYNIGNSIDEFIKIQNDKLADYAKQSKGVRFYIPAVEEVMRLMESGAMTTPSSPTRAKQTTQTAATSVRVTNKPVSAGSQESAITTATSLKAEGRLDEALKVLREEARNVKKSEGEYSASLIPINELAGEILAQKGDTESLAQLDKLKIKTQDIKDRTSQSSADTASVDAQTAQVSAQSVTVSSAKPAEPSSPAQAKEQTQANAATAPDAIKATEQTASAAQTTADNSDIQAKAAEEATTLGSIYTHDTHCEKVLYEILSALTGKKVEAPKLQQTDISSNGGNPQQIPQEYKNIVNAIAETKQNNVQPDSIVNRPDGGRTETYTLAQNAGETADEFIKRATDFALSKIKSSSGDSRAKQWLEQRKPNIPTPQSLQQQETLTTPRMQLPERNKKQTLARLAELKKKGGYGIARPDGSSGRSYSEQDEYMQLQEQTRTPYEQARLARRQAYLSRFRPEVRERMLTKDEKAEQKFYDTKTNVGTVPQQQIAAYTTDKLDAISGSIMGSIGSSPLEKRLQNEMKTNQQKSQKQKIGAYTTDKLDAISGSIMGSIGSSPLEKRLQEELKIGKTTNISDTSKVNKNIIDPIKEQNNNLIKQEKEISKNITFTRDIYCEKVLYEILGALKEKIVSGNFSTDKGNDFFAWLSSESVVWKNNKSSAENTPKDQIDKSKNITDALMDLLFKEDPKVDQMVKLAEKVGFEKERNEDLYKQNAMSSMASPIPINRQPGVSTQINERNQQTGGQNQTQNNSAQGTQFLDSLNAAFNNFGSYITSLERAASNLPSKIDLVLVAEPIDVNVNLTGAAVLEELKKAPESIKNMIDEQISVSVGQKVQKISDWVKSVSGKDFSPGQ